MSRLRLLIGEAWSSIRQNISTTFAATMTVLIGMFLLGLFIALGTWVLSYSNHVQKELQVKVFFTSTATQQQEAFVYSRLKADPRVKTIPILAFANHEEVDTFNRAKALGVTKIVSRNEFSARLKDLVGEVAGNHA